MKDVVSADESVGGDLIGARGGPQRYGEGRVCALPGCGTLLSIYNAESFCAVHEHLAEPTPQAYRKRRRRPRVGASSLAS
jgi:hypothetical protein